MKDHSTILNDEALRTFLVETKAVMNSRPLTVEHLSDPSNSTLLSPIQLLTFKSDIVFPPPGEFHRNDIYCCKYYKRVHHFTRHNGWPMARVEEVFPSADDLVRKVYSRVAL